MSTPLSVDSPPITHARTDSEQKRDLQEKIQRMITLQHHSTLESSNEDDDEGLNGVIFSRESDDRSRGLLTKSAVTEMENFRSLGGNPEAMAEKSTNQSSVPRSSENQPLGDRLPPHSPHSGIGWGTLVFPSTFNHMHRVGSADGSVQSVLSVPMVGLGQSQVPPPPPPLPPSRGAFPPRQIYTGYGSLGTAASHPHGDDLQQFQAETADHHQHEFHYGNPDFNNPYDGDTKTRQHRSEGSICAQLCCLYSPLTNLLLRDNVLRSLCFGSIDGMLTGSGIVSAFCALRVLSSTATWEVRVAVVAFTAAACLADAVCMAVGHIWTSFVMSSGHARERSRERLLLDADKANAKARLVDMLLARGMLKIDAMSLADTLEGYPDMFVSALLGDSLFAGTDLPEDESDDGQEQHHIIPMGGIRSETDGSFGGLSWKFPSYGRFNETEDDPESHVVSAIWKDSQIEGFFMMLGFSTFAMIPSLLWLLLPHLLIPDSTIVIESSIASPTKMNGQVISLPSLVVSVSGVLMWFLGGWKSRYLDSNWIMSGIENVLVLLVCVLSAYGVGFGLCYLIGGDDGVTLTNVVSHKS